MGLHGGRGAHADGGGGRGGGGAEPAQLRGAGGRWVGDLGVGIGALGWDWRRIDTYAKQTNKQTNNTGASPDFRWPVFEETRASSLCYTRWVCLCVGCRGVGVLFGRAHTEQRQMDR